MKRLVKIFTNFSPIRKSHAVYAPERFEVESRIIDRKLGVLGDIFTVSLGGKEENIEMFLQSLKCEGFKIE